MSRKSNHSESSIMKIGGRYLITLKVINEWLSNMDMYVCAVP